MIREGSYAELSRRVQETLAARRTPLNVTIEVTRRCPLQCAHCYNNLPMSDAAARQRELSTTELLRILDQLIAQGTLWLLFTGGEIFARRDFLEIYGYAHEKGFFITLFTNATLITEEIADELAMRRPFAIEVTLYGATRETYEALTGIPGSYDKCLRGVRLLRDRGLPLKLKTVAVSVNQHEIEDMRRFAEQELGVPFKFDGLINPRVDCSQSPLEVRLTPRELVRLDLVNEDRVSEYRDLAVRYAESDASRAKTVYSCGGGVNSFAIDPYGRMSICSLSEREKYGLREGTVQEGWGEFLGAVRNRPISRPTKCTSCALKSFCGMCPANGELENGDPESPVEFLCEVAHLRAAAFGVASREHGECGHCAGGDYKPHVIEAARELQAEIDDARQPQARRTPRVTEIAGGCSGGCSSCGPPELG